MTLLDRIHETAFTLLVILAVDYPTLARPIEALRRLVNRLHGEHEPDATERYWNNVYGIAGWPIIAKPWSERTPDEVDDWEWQLAIARIADRMAPYYSAA